MKRIRINAYQVALVFKRGVYERALTEGKYWLGWNESVIVYDIGKQFIAPVDMNILLKDEMLSNLLTVVNVKDNEIALQYENGLFKAVLTAGRYAFWKGVTDYAFTIADISKIEITEDIDKAVLQNKLLALYVRSYTVESYEKAVLFVDGKFKAVLEPGVYFWWRNNTVINVGKADMRLQQAEINGQEILTKDKAALRVNAFAQFKVADVEKALLENKDYERQLYVVFQFALREYISGLGFDELLERKDSIAAYILESVRSNAEVLGVEVKGFGIRDIILPGDVKDIMNKVLVAEKTAQANTILRREETAGTRNLLNTAKLMEDNKVLFKLKELEYVEKIAEKISNIQVNGNGALIEQLKGIFMPKD